jgi:hypothetical protein
MGLSDSVRRLPEGYPNCLPIMPGWNHTLKMYRPSWEIIDGTWKFAEAQPVQ